MDLPRRLAVAGAIALSTLFLVACGGRPRVDGGDGGVGASPCRRRPQATPIKPGDTTPFPLAGGRRTGCMAHDGCAAARRSMLTGRQRATPGEVHASSRTTRRSSRACPMATTRSRSRTRAARTGRSRSTRSADAVPRRGAQRRRRARHTCARSGERQLLLGTRGRRGHPLLHLGHRDGRRSARRRGRPSRPGRAA